jgi:hypothetical protein
MARQTNMMSPRKRERTWRRIGQIDNESRDHFLYKAKSNVISLGSGRKRMGKLCPLFTYVETSKEKATNSCLV